MTLVIDPDALGGDALDAMAAHVVGPLRGGVAGDEIALDSAGAGKIELPTRNALLVVALRAELGGTPCNVDVSLDGAPAQRLVFAPFSPRNVSLALALPARDATLPISIKIADASASAGTIVHARYVDGVLARVLYVLGSEKARIRTCARAIAAGRFLEHASGPSLDRLGQELGVTRFAATVAWDAANHQFAATPAAESDERYRARLRIYRPFVRPTRASLDAALAADQGGLLAASGYRGRITSAESDTELAIAVRIVAPPQDQNRLDYLAYLRKRFLVPLDAADLPADRPVSPEQRAFAHTLLARLKAGVKWPAGAYVAMPIAVAVDRAARCIAALGVTAPIAITTAQRDDGGSRYELGLGIDVARFDTATLSALVTAAAARTITGSPSADIRALIASLTPQPAGVDPDARWLWEPCGMRTVHALASGATFLSHLPMHGAQLSVTAHPPGRLRLDAALSSPGDPNPAMNAQLASTLSTAAAGGGADAATWTVAGASATLTSVLTGATPAPAAAAATFRAQGLTTPATQTQIQAIHDALQNKVVNEPLSIDQFAGLRLDATTSSTLLASQPAGATRFAEVITRLRRAGAISVLPLVMGADVYLVVGATDLPGAVTLNSRRTQWRWFALPLGEDARIGSLEDTISSSNHYTYSSDTSNGQLAAIIAVTPTRAEPLDLANRIDPYTVAIDAAGQPPLTFDQYEYLMNLLDRWCPLGVTIDTSRIRRAHVDLDGDGVPDLVDQTLQHTFRPFQAPRRFSARTDRSSR